MSNLPFGYLISILFLAWTLYGVLAPPHWPRLFKSLSFYSGVINELPFLGLFWVLGSTGLAFLEGDIFSPVGWLTFILALFVTIGLIVIIYRGLKDVPEVRHALDKGLEEGWRDSIHPKIDEQLERNFDKKALLGPFFMRRADVERIPNIRYSDADARNQLDLYRHASHPTGCPVLIHFHGGSFVRGRKNSQSLPLLYQLASKGWICISANYRLSPAASFPDHLTDAKKVIAWVREHGEEFGADPSMIFIAGNSSGAHIAAMAALTANDPRFQPGFEEVDTTVSGAICQYGYYGAIHHTTGISSSPMAYSGKDAPPFFILHGGQDQTVSVEHGRCFSEHLRRSSPHPIVYVELPYARHIIDLFHSIRTEAVIHGIEAFTDWVRSTHKQAMHPHEKESE